MSKRQRSQGAVLAGQAIRSSLLALLLVFALPALAGATPAGDQTELHKGVDLWRAGQFAEAVQLWQPLAHAGDPQGMLFVAFAYRTGRGVARDDRQAFHWYLQAAQAGMPEAQMEVGLMYELGIGTAVDAAEAAAWYGLATGGDYCPSELPAGGVLGGR